MRSLAIGAVWVVCTLPVAAHAASLDPMPQKVAPTLPSLRIQSTTPIPDSPLTNPNVRRVTPTVTPGWDFGCAVEHFAPAERIAVQTRFAMPIPASDIWGMLPEPAVTHYDRDGVRHNDYFRCTPFGAGHVCYDGHEGTDFTLGAGLLGTTRASAAAGGVALEVDDHHFDGCHANPDPRAYIDSDLKNNVICPDPDHPESVAVTSPNLGPTLPCPHIVLQTFAGHLRVQEFRGELGAVWPHDGVHVFVSAGLAEASDAFQRFEHLIPQLALEVHDCARIMVEAQSNSIAIQMFGGNQFRRRRTHSMCPAACARRNGFASLSVSSATPSTTTSTSSPKHSTNSSAPPLATAWPSDPRPAGRHRPCAP